MKKTLIFVLAAIMVVAFAGVAFAKVSGSKHDLHSNNYAGTGTTQVCVFCHHPHRGSNGITTNVGNALLWNVDDFSRTTYTAYQQSNTMNATTASVDKAVPQSYLCMACHDGTIGIGALVSKPIDGTNILVAKNLATLANLGTTLADDHPVNFEYGATPRDSGTVANTNDAVNTGNGTYLLFAGYMQCGTCHDVHAGRGDSKASLVDFMRGNIDNSEICVDCHTNK